MYANSSRCLCAFDSSAESLHQYLLKKLFVCAFFVRTTGTSL